MVVKYFIERPHFCEPGTILPLCHDCHEIWQGLVSSVSAEFRKLRVQLVHCTSRLSNFTNLGFSPT
jgi:hypothetical protein